EFFELFKTPWEFCRRDRRYRVLLVTDGAPIDRSADLVLVYGSESVAFDQACNRLPGPPRSRTTLSWTGECLPIYGSAVGFAADAAAGERVLANPAEPAAWVKRADGRTFIRVGYDLFREIRHLLTQGQPPTHASVPTLERHIALLRS